MKKLSLFLLLGLVSMQALAGKVQPLQLQPVVKKPAGKVAQQPRIDCTKITCITVTEDLYSDCPAQVSGSSLEPDEPIAPSRSVFDGQAL